MPVTLLERFQSAGPKRILALDGGGMRGLISLGILDEVERILRERYANPNFRLCDYFDLIGGTSTGAIIAAGLAMGLTTSDVRKMYLELGGVAFADHGLRFWRLWRSKFNDRPLQEQLEKFLGNRTLGDPRFRTGLCIITKRADTGSTWRLFNHPNGRYFEANRDILVSKAVRASVAAPYFFKPEALEVTPGEIGAFVDGGVSMANNPGLELFLVATLKGFPFRWETGARKLMLVSVGTGSWTKLATVPAVLRRNPLRSMRATIETLINDTDWHGQTILQAMSNSPTAWPIDSEVGDLRDDMLTGTPALHYLRYNVLMEPESLVELGREDQSLRVERLRNAFGARECTILDEIGQAAGRLRVAPEHFPAVFDVLQSP